MNAKERREWFAFENRLQPPIPSRQFFKRLLQRAGYASLAIAVSLGLGMVGYHWIAHFTWVDSFLNACMLLGGMGPVGDLPNAASKIFAGLFALYSGFVVLLVAAMMLTPIFHRVLHHFHWAQQTDDK